MFSYKAIVSLRANTVCIGYISLRALLLIRTHDNENRVCLLNVMFVFVKMKIGIRNILLPRTHRLNSNSECERARGWIWKSNEHGIQNIELQKPLRASCVRNEMTRCAAKTKINKIHPPNTTATYIHSTQHWATSKTGFGSISWCWFHLPHYILWTLRFFCFSLSSSLSRPSIADFAEMYRAHHSGPRKRFPFISHLFQTNATFIRL